MAALLGGPVFGTFEDADSWANAHVVKGYRAAYAPPIELVTMVGSDALRQAAAAHDITIAEVGAWVNPVSTNVASAREARTDLVEGLRLAEELGARCCVDIVGSASPTAWDGAAAEGYSESFIEQVIDAFREVIDTAAPTHTVMAFETMPYNFLDSPDAYVQFLTRLDRPGQTGVHVDLCNMVTTPRIFYQTPALAARTVELLGADIRSCHIKDLVLDDSGATVKFREVLPGTGGVDLGAYVAAIDSLDHDVPMMLEHLGSEQEYDLAAVAVRQAAAAAGVLL